MLNSTECEIVGKDDRKWIFNFYNFWKRVNNEKLKLLSNADSDEYILYIILLQSGLTRYL